MDVSRHNEFGFLRLRAEFKTSGELFGCTIVELSTRSPRRSAIRRSSGQHGPLARLARTSVAMSIVTLRAPPIARAGRAHSSAPSTRRSLARRARSTALGEPERGGPRPQDRALLEFPYGLLGDAGLSGDRGKGEAAERAVVHDSVGCQAAFVKSPTRRPGNCESPDAISPPCVARFLVFSVGAQRDHD
jgi:hypothetical protein